MVAQEVSQVGMQPVQVSAYSGGISSSGYAMKQEASIELL